MLKSPPISSTWISLLFFVPLSANNSSTKASAASRLVLYVKRKPSYSPEDTKASQIPLPIPRVPPVMMASRLLLCSARTQQLLQSKSRPLTTTRRESAAAAADNVDGADLPIQILFFLRFRALSSQVDDLSESGCYDASIPYLTLLRVELFSFYRIVLNTDPSKM